MGKNRNKAALSKAVSRYMAKHYKIIWVRREFHDKISDAARKVGLSIPGFIYEMFNRYGEKLASELLAERSKSAQVTMTKSVEASKVEVTTQTRKHEVAPEPGFLIIDLGVCGRFKIREGDWKLFVEIVESTRDPVTGSVLERLPAHLRGLFKQMRMLPAVKYNVKMGVWMIDYSKFRIIRAR
jgi:dihydrodipicolinate synthase/N-acetylneuraminate lyase